MKGIIRFSAWAFVAAAVLYLALNPQTGVIYQSPMSALGLGMIGLGICMEMRKRRMQQASR
jgi:hypothetical protein